MYPLLKTIKIHEIHSLDSIARPFVRETENLCTVVFDGIIDISLNSSYFRIIS